MLALNHPKKTLVFLKYLAYATLPRFELSLAEVRYHASIPFSLQIFEIRSVGIEQPFMSDLLANKIMGNGRSLDNETLSRKSCTH